MKNKLQQSRVKHHGGKVSAKRSGQPSPPVKALFPWIALILVLTFIVFSPALRNELVSWDDYNYISENPVIQLLNAQNIAHIFHYRTFIMGNYHPLTILSYAIEYSMVGASPFLYHLDNLLLHMCNVLLVAWIVWLMTRRQWATLLAAALFALHHMRVESVVWAAERKDVLYSFFFFLSLILYIKYLTQQQGKGRNYFLSALLFILSILSKGQAVVLPLTFFLVDYWFKRKLDWKSVRDKIPFLVISLLSGILSLVAQSSSLTSQRLVVHTLPERILIGGFNLSAYLYKVIFPYNLACFYGYPTKEGMWLVYLGAIIALALLVWIFIRYRKNRLIMFGTLFFLCTIFIVIQLIPVGNAIIADRYTYIPYFGFFFIIALLVDGLYDRNRRYFRISMTIISFQLIIFAVASFLQSQTWRDNITLWSRAIANDPNQGLAYNNLGMVFLEEKKYDTAVTYLQKAILSDRPYEEKFRAWHNLGKAYQETGRPVEGVAAYNEAISIYPNYTDAFFGRGLAYTDAAMYDSAIADFTLILNSLKPGHDESYYSRAIAWNRKRQSDSAIADYTRAIMSNPSYANAYVNRGNVYFNLGNPFRAIPDYDSALRYDPENASTWMNRSFARFKTQDFTGALSDALRAQNLKADVNPAYLQDLQRLITHSKK